MTRYSPQENDFRTGLPFVGKGLPTYLSQNLFLETYRRRDLRLTSPTTMPAKKRPPTHPGEMLLKEFLAPLGVTQKQFAKHFGWTYARLNEIINGRRRVTADSALAFGEALETGPEFWLNLQHD